MHLKTNLSAPQAAFGLAVVLAGLNLLALWAAEPASSPQFIVTPSHSNAVYAPGEPIRWRVQVNGGAGSNLAQADYVLKQGGLTLIRQAKLALTNAAAPARTSEAAAPAKLEGQIETTLADPDTVLLEIKAEPEGKTLRALGGAVVAPERIQPSAPPPRDFDDFWEAKLKELSRVPPNPQLVPGDSTRPGVDYWYLTMDNIRGTHIRGQLARPHAGNKLPGMLIVQWAGVYALQKDWVKYRAGEGWLVLDINAHDLPIDEAPQFYEQQLKGPLKDYWTIGNDNRDSSYFLRMYLSCYRAAQYLTERPDWDGKTLVVAGTSQGGLQALMTAALHPKITAALACVPAGCDLAGPEAARAPGWPAWYYNTQGKEPAKVIEASRYYDVVNFARRVRCPVLVGVGLIDEVCPPAGILAALNQVKGPKEIVLLPYSDHQGVNNSQQPFRQRETAWQNALRQGRPVPLEN